MASISNSGSISSISGLASGIQWSELIDQIMKLESAQQLEPLTTQITAKQRQQSAWRDYQNVLAKLSDAAKSLRDGTAFGTLKTTVGNSPTSGRSLLTASASASAAPGAFKVEVQDIARAEKVAGGVYASATTALGVSGDFVVNGRHVDITAADTLSSIRDKINGLNTGSSPTQVTATILSTSPTANRLVLTSDVTGASGIELTDGAAGALSQLGFLDSTRVANTRPDGSAQSSHFSITTTAIAALLGITTPPAETTIKVNGQSVHVNLATDSLSYIASLVRATGASAETVTETSNGVTSYRLVVGGTVTADPADAANSQRALELLGFQQAGRGAEAQSAVTNTP